MSPKIKALYAAMGPTGAHSVDQLARDIADECAEADIQCHCYDSVLRDSGRIYQVTNARAQLSDWDPDQVEYDTRSLQRAVRYLILRQRIKIVARSGGTWVRIIAA